VSCKTASSEWTSVVNTAEKIANFWDVLDGQPLFTVFCGMCLATLHELKAILKVNAQAEQSGAVNKTSGESMAQDGHFQKVKRRKRQIYHDTSQAAKKTPWSLVRERTIPTDRPPLVDEI
jgi:hypothetical protein